jgi:L-iditol 2-dehydrogenase
MTIADPSPGWAARLHGRRDVRLGPAVRPAPAPDEVVLRVTAVGLCGSDLHWYDGGAIGDTRLTRPLVLGHELAAVIDDGPRAGERVAVDPADPCDACPVCLSGLGRLCPDVRFAGLDPLDGGLQTWLAWPGSRCATLPDAIPDDEATLLEVAGIGLHAADLAELRPGMHAGVYGAGPIGQLLIRILVARGVTEITATDRLAHRVAAALESGATEGVLVGDEDRAARIPVDVAFECSGDDGALATAVRAVRPAGRVLLVGIPAGEVATFPASPVRRKELRLQAVRRMEAADLPRAIELVRTGELSLDGLVTDRFELDDVATAFERASTRDGMKVVVRP